MGQDKSYTLSKLSNGLEWLHVPLASAHSVFIMMVGRVGRRAELDSEVGAAHFLEHLFFDGTKKRPSATEINRFIEEAGAIRNGTTGQEMVDYFVKIIPENAEAGFDFIADIFLNSLLKEIDKERKVIAQEAVAKRDDPLQFLGRRRLSTLYPSQNIGRTIFDEEANLDNINKESLLGYYERVYGSENFLLVTAGAIDKDKASKLAEKYFAKVKRGKKVQFQPARMNQDKVVDICNRSQLKQSKLSISFQGVELNHPDTAAVALLSVILGGGLSSRLYERLRNQLHLAYYTGAYPVMLSDTGFLAIEAFVDEGNLQQTLDETVGQLNLLIEKGVEPDELERAKNIYLSRLLFRSENVISLADGYASQYLLSGKIIDVDQMAESIKSLTDKEVLRLAKTIFNHKPKVNILTAKLKEIKI